MRTPQDLRGYQQRLVTRFYEHARTLAIVPMGGGKTACALTAIGEMLHDGVIRAALVLAPLRVASLVWPNEPQLWAHLEHLRVRVVDGGPGARAAALATPADVYAVGVDNTQWLTEHLTALPRDHPLFDMLVIDEISRFKDPQGKRGKALMKLSRRFRNVVGLTGTPRPNGTFDLFRPTQIVSGGAFAGVSFTDWRKRYYTPDFLGYTWTPRDELADELATSIARWTVRIGDDDMPDMPPLTTTVHRVELPPKARKHYDTMARHLIGRFGDVTVLAANAAVATGKLAQIANGFVYDEAGAVHHVHTEKADRLVDLVEDLSGDPVIICYEFREDLRVLQELYPDAALLGAGVSGDEAAEVERRWNRGELPILLLHPASAGHGLNLQHGGAQMIWYSLPWSTELFDQTRKRFHRPGQTRHCFEHVILATDTVDEQKRAVVLERMSLQQAFVARMPEV